MDLMSFRVYLIKKNTLFLIATVGLPHKNLPTSSKYLAHMNYFSLHNIHGVEDILSHPSENEDMDR